MTPNAPEAKQELVGYTLANVRQAQTELVLSFEPPPGSGPERHLICQPQFHIIDDPERPGRKIPHITGMKYEIGEGPITIMVQALELRGEARELIGQIVTAAILEPRLSVLAIYMGQYSLVLSTAGVKALHSKELTIEFGAPLVVQ